MVAEKGFQGARLRVARLLSGLTKADLAERLSVSRQFVHALEIGEKQASADMVAALSLVLKVMPHFFYDVLNNEVREEECHFRSRRSMPEKVAEQVVSHGTALELVVRHLEGKLELPRVNFPAIEIRAVDDIESAAESSRIHWKLGQGPIANMCRVLENAGAVVTDFKGDRHELDALSMARSRPIVLRNTVKQSPGRYRFDLAHECAHLIIHQGMLTGDKETEQQANRFASAFLMPKSTFAAEFPVMDSRLDWSAIYAMKVRWRVSAKAVIRRASDLGLIDAVQYASANRFLNHSGQAKVERFDEMIPVESPELLSAAISAYAESFDASPAQFAKEIGMTPSLIGQLIGIDAMRKFH